MAMSYDPRMTNPFNKVVEEYHHIEFEPDCTVWPLEEGSEAGFSTAFFREDFTIIGSETTDDPAEYRELKPHEDYVFSPLMLSVASRTGREAFSYVVILRDSIKHVKISYHAVGGVADKTLLSEISLLGVFDRTDRKIWMNLRGQELGVPSAPKDVDAIGLSAIEVLAVKLDKIYTAMTMDTLISPPLLDVIQQQQDQINAHGDTINQIVQTAPAAHLDNRIDKILETLNFTDLQTKYPNGSYPVINGGVAQPKVADLFTGINNLLKGQLQNNAKALGTSISPNDLFNDSDRGVYFQSSNINAVVANGYPAPYAGTLTVSKAAGIIQTYQTYGLENRIYQRGYYNSTWSTWIEVVTTKNANQYGSPIGCIIAYAGLVAPTGWIICDGRSLVRVDYPSLYALIGTTYNSGSVASTHFKIPDLRGQFIRGVNGSSSGIDPLRALGSTQEPAMPDHIHLLGFSAKNGSTQSTWATAGGEGNLYSGYYAPNGYSSGDKYNSGGSSWGRTSKPMKPMPGARGASPAPEPMVTSNDSRPANIALNYIIRAD